MAVPNNTLWLPIANSALTMVGTRLLSTVSDQSKEALLINTNWDTCRRNVLRDGLWKFAKNQVTLTVDGTFYPAFGFNNRYALPADFIRLVGFNDLKGNSDGSEAPYRVMAGYIYTFMSYANLTYIYDCQDITKYDPMFCECLAAALYTKVCKSLTGTDADPKAYAMMMQKARFTDSVEDPSVQLDIDVWLQSRFGGPTLYRDPKFNAETTPDFP